MRFVRSLAPLAAVLVLAAGCGSDDDDGGDDTSASEPAEADDGGGGGGSASEITTVGALGLDVPASVPAEFPVPADAVVLSSTPGGQDGERLDVTIGTFATRDDVTPAVQAYIESLESGSFSAGSGQGFIDVDGTLTPVIAMISTTDAEDPPTRITVSVPNT